MATLLGGLVVLALYAWAHLSGDIHSPSGNLLISQNVAIAAAVAVVFSFVFAIWVPKKFIFPTAVTAFLVQASMVGYLIITTGGIASPFIALWILISVFAGIFGVWGIVPLFVAVNSCMVVQYFGAGIGRDAIIMFVLIGDLPLLASYLIWHHATPKANEGDKAYRDLASELSQVANKSEVVINAIADGVIAVNSQGVIQLINPAAQQIIGWGKQDALALDYKSVLKLVDQAGNELTPATDPIAATLASNKQTKTDSLNLMTNSQKKILVSVNVSPVGQLGAGAIIVFRDITKEKAEEREQAEFISTASHEMRTPVASIEGYLGLALNPATAQIDEKARDYINKAHESAQHLGRLFSDLLDVSKAEDGRLSNKPKVTDVVQFTHDIIEGLRPQAEAKGLRMLFKPLPNDDAREGERTLSPVFFVNVDNDHLREITANLVENAIKYTPKGDITIDVTGDNDHVVISVADSGIGIPKEDQVHLFQKFYRVDNSDTREIGGTGLGLYLSRRLAEAMNGRLWVESEYKQGSTFSLSLDRISHEDATRLIEAASNESAPQITPTAQPILAAEPLQPVQPVVTPPVAPMPLAPVVQAVAPVVAAPITQPTAPQPAPAAPIRTTTPPMSISTIEQNADQYVQSSRRNMNIPPRA